MKITLQNIGKRYNSQWIFRNVNLEFTEGNNYVIMGSNGSGKSTLLQVVAGNYMPSEGKINYFNSGNSDETGKEISADYFYTHISFSSPYLELMEEFTLRETIQFHSKFKKIRNGLNAEKIIERCYLGDSADKCLKDYSSGMKQRVKLALAILSDTKVLLLDEPCSNLDKRGVEWYSKMIEENKTGRLIIVCSNQHPEEYSFCDKEIKVEDYK